MKARKNILDFTAVIYPDADSDWLVAHNPETEPVSVLTIDTFGRKK